MSSRLPQTEQRRETDVSRTEDLPEDWEPTYEGTCRPGRGGRFSELLATAGATIDSRRRSGACMGIRSSN